MKTVHYLSVEDRSTLVDIAVLTAADVERQAVLACMELHSSSDGITKVLWRETVYYVGVIGMYKCVMTMSDQGDAGRGSAQAAATSMLERWQPRAIVMPGMCFGKNLPGEKKRQCLGDLLVSTRIFPYGPARENVEGTVSRGPNPEAGHALLSRARNIPWTWKPTTRSKKRSAQFGALLSGQKLVDNPEKKQELFERHPMAIGGEMEGYGLYAAASKVKVEWLIFKAIVDWADGRKNKKAQTRGVKNAVEFLVLLLSEPGLTDLPRATTDAVVTSLNSKDYILEMIRDDIRKKHEARQKSIDILVNFAENNMGDPNREQYKLFFETLKSSINTATEVWLNAYNDACAKYLEGSVPGSEFERLFSNEVCEFVEVGSELTNPILKPRTNNRYTAIWEVYDRVASRRRD